MTDAAIESITARRRRLVRDDLALVALELFGARGFDAVTIDDVAVAAGISQRTFFRYFASKEAVVLDYERRVHERLVRAFDERPASESPVESLRHAYVATSHVDERDRSRVVLLGRILAEAPVLRARAHGERATETAPLIARLAERMRVNPHTDPRPRTAVVAMAAVASSEWQAWVESGGEGDPAARINAALQILERGLAGTSLG